MSVSGTADAVDSIALAISTQLHPTAVHEQPADVSFTVDKSSSESALENPLLLPKEDASNCDHSANADSVSGPSAEPRDAANGHAPTADAVPQAIRAHSKGDGETTAVSDDTTNAEDALLGSVTTPSDSVAAENPAVAAVTAENEYVKEVDDAPAADAIDDATTAEDQGPTTSESVTVLAEESLADKTINDSAIEIPAPALEKKEDGKDHGLADKPDVETVEPIMDGESAVNIPGETIHTQVDVPHVEEVVQAEEIKDGVPAESDGVAITETEPSLNEGDVPVSTTETQDVLNEAVVDCAETAAVEKAGADQIPEEQPQTEVTPEELVNKPEDESGAVGGVEQEETAHEAEPIAAEVNNVGNDNHEAVEQPIVKDEPVAAEEANGNEAILEQLDEHPEVIETTPFVEEPQVDGVVGDAGVEQVEELAGEGVTVHEVQDSIVNDEAPTAEAEPVEITAEEVPLSVEAVESTSEATPLQAGPAEVAIDETPASIEAELVTGEEESAPEPVVAAEVDEEVTAAVEAEAAGEEALAPVAVEAIAEDEVAIEESPVPVEAAGEEPPIAVEAEDEAVAREGTPVAPEAGPTAEATVSEEIAAPVEPEPIVNKEAPVTVEAEPAVDAAANEEAPAPVAVEAEPAVEVGTSEETPAPVEVEPVVSEEIPVAVQAEESASKPTTDVTSEEAPAPGLIASETTPIETEPAAEVTEVAAPIVIEASSEITSQDTSAPAEVEPIPEAVNEETSTAIESEANTSEETLGSAPVEAEPVIQPTDEVLPTLVGVTAPAGTEVADEDASESKPVTDIAGEIDSSEPAGAAAATHEDVPVHVDEAEVPLGEVSFEAVPDETQASEIASDRVPVEANPEPVAEMSASEAAPVEVQEVPCEDNIISVEAEDAPVGVAQEEIAVEGTPATVDPTEPSKEYALGHVADTEPESLVEPTQEGSEAGIKDDAEVALEGASIALATNAVEETLSAVSSELVKEANVAVVHDEQLAPTLAQNGHLSDVLEPPITIDQERQPEPVADDAPGAEPLPGLKTENLYVQTALDTTHFTPIVDSGIELKEYESQPSHLLSIAEEIERPKSPWSPSFQVTTIGHGELPEEDTEKAPIQNDFKTEKLADVVVAATPDLTEVVTEQEPLANIASEDTANGQPLEPSAEPWTSSYSVHLQGVLTQTNAEVAPVVEEQHVADDDVLVETVASEFQAEPDIDDAVESEIKMEDNTEQVPDVVVQESAESGSETKENIDVVSTDTTEPPTEEIAATVTVIALADEGVNEASETSSHEEEPADSLVDTLESSVKTWTTSYSVHAQGTSTVLGEAATPTADTKPLEVETSPESKEQAAELPILSVSTESIEGAVLEAPTESWTPSYSVHSQGSTPAELDVASAEPDPTADEQRSPMVAAKELEASELIMPEPPVTSEDLEGTPTHDVEPIEFAALKDPWTSPPASKDVAVAEIVHHSQSDGAAHTIDLQDEQVDKNTEATLTDAVAPVVAIAAIGAVAASLAAIGESDDVTSKIDATVDKIIRPVLSVSVDEAVTNTEANNTTTDVSDQFWTPSYSVMHQGSSPSREGEDKQESQPIAKAPVAGDLEPQLNEVQEPNAVQLRPEYSVAGAENFAQNEKFMLFGLRAIVAYLWVLPKWLSMTRSPSESGHTRQASSSSSSSSKFFPGGWFTPKPNEGGTSLDVAQGEFAPSPKITTTTDVFETLNVQNEAGTSTGLVTDGDVDGQKRKWCVVM